MQSKVHPTYKTKYRVANWAAYNQALVRRGDVTVWLSSEAIAAWTPGRSGRRGGQRRYSDLAIETALTLRLLYHLPLRQAEGFLHALFGMMRLDLFAHDSTTLSRRSQHLQRRLRPVPPGEGLHLVLDSTGLSIVGAGEWAAAKHGGCGRRGWRKLHLGVDQSGVIRVHTLTAATGDDATTALDLLTAVEGPLVRVRPWLWSASAASGVRSRGAVGYRVGCWRAYRVVSENSAEPITPLGNSMATRSGSLRTPRFGIGASEYGRDYRLDYGLRVFEDGGMSFDLSVGANRRISRGRGGAEHGVQGRLTARWQ